MVKGFWEHLKKPFFCMAPMADVTDVAFRRMFARYGKRFVRGGEGASTAPVFWTEFVSSDGLFLMPEKSRESGVGSVAYQAKYAEVEAIALEHGIKKGNLLLNDLLFYDDERPIVAQFFSTDPERMRASAGLARALGFDGIDINMGCPADVICKQGAGAAMIKTPDKAREIIRATMEGAEHIPVSVKTRIGYTKDELDTWLPELLKEKPAVITLHARTRKDMSKVPARWETLPRALSLRDEYSPETYIVGNGDVMSMAEARQRIEESKCDGVMVGRGIFGNPWFFDESIDAHALPLDEKFRVMLEHTKTFEDYLGGYKSFALMKKHFKAYVNGFDGAKELRTELMATDSSREVEIILRRALAERGLSMIE